MKTFLAESAKLCVSAAAVAVGFLSFGSGKALLMDEGARQKYLLERQRDELVRACEKAPTSVVLHAELMLAHESLGDYQSVFRGYEKLMALDPENPAHRRNFAGRLATLRTEGARYYQCALEDVPTRVIGHYKSAIRLAPTNVSLAKEYAMSFYVLGGEFESEVAAAWKHVIDAATDEQDRLEGHLHLARWWTRFEKLDRARWHLHRAMGYHNSMLLDAAAVTLARAESEKGVSLEDYDRFAAKRRLNKRQRHARL